MKAALTSFTAPSDPVPTPRPERMSAEQAATVSANAFAGLMEHLGYLDATSIEQVREAYAFADLAHSDQWRSSAAIRAGASSFHSAHCAATAIGWVM